MNKLVACVLSSAWALLASGADLSNEVGVKHWLRDALTYDDESDTFSTNALSGVAASAALETSAAALPVLMDEATEALRADLEPMQARLEIEAQRPVVMITGAAGLDNALDRENLTMAVVSNEWTVAADGSRHLDCYVFSNKILASPPIVDAALMTDLGTVTNWVRGVWDGYGTRACTVELEHQNAYTNFVIVSRTYGETKVLETNVTFTSIFESYRMDVVERRSKFMGVESVRTTGSGIVNAGVFSATDIDFVIECMPTALPSAYNNGNGSIFGARQSSVANGYQFTTFAYATDLGGHFKFGANCSSSANRVPAYMSKNEYRIFSKIGNAFTDGRGISTVFDEKTMNAELEPFEIVIGALNEKGSISEYVDSYIKRLEFSRGGVKIRSFRPAVDDSGCVCFYDEVRDEYVRPSIHSWTAVGTPTEKESSIPHIVTNYIPISVTNTYCRTIALTNAVLITIDGQQPQVTLRGDKEYFECYRLGFDLPPAESVRLNPWVKIGHPETGFDFGNRQLRINGAMTVTTNDVSEIGEWFTPDGNRVELTPYLDQGLLRFSDLKEDEE